MWRIPPLLISTRAGANTNKTSTTCGYRRRADLRPLQHLRFAYAHGDGDSFGYAYLDPYGYSYFYAHSNRYCYSDVNGYSYGNGNCYGYTDCDSNSYSQTDTDAKGSGDAESPSHATAEAVGLDSALPRAVEVVVTALCRRAETNVTAQRGGYIKKSKFQFQYSQNIVDKPTVLD